MTCIRMFYNSIRQIYVFCSLEWNLAIFTANIFISLAKWLINKKMYCSLNLMVSKSHYHKTKDSKTSKDKPNRTLVALFSTPLWIIWLLLCTIKHQLHNVLYIMCTTPLLVCPMLFYCKHLSFVANKSDQRAMKTAIKYFWPFSLFINEGRKTAKLWLPK